MKVFEVPQMEIVMFGKTDVMTTSPGCYCVDCTKCEVGSNDCRYVDTCPTYCPRDGV